MLNSIFAKIKQNSLGNKSEIQALNFISHINSKKEYTHVSSHLLNIIVNGKYLSSTASKVWLFLYNISKKTHELICSVSIDFISHHINRCYRTILRLLDELESKGFLIIERCYGGKKGRLKSVYQISVPKDVEDDIVKMPDRKGVSDMGFLRYFNLPTSTLNTEVNVDSQNKSTKKDQLCDINVIYNTNINIKDNNNNNVINFETLPISSDVSPIDEKIDTSVAVDFFNEAIKDVQSSINVLIDKDKKHLYNYFEENKSINDYEFDSLLDMDKKELNARISILNRLKNVLKNKSLLRIKAKEILNNSEIDIFKKKKNFYSKNSWLLDYASEEYNKNQINEAIINNKIHEMEVLSKKLKEDFNFLYCLNDIFYVGHDMGNSENRIPINILINIKNSITNIVPDEQINEIVNEVAYSIRFADLSKCKNKFGFPCRKKGINVALKLIREKKWKTPRTMSDVKKYMKDDFDLFTVKYA